MTLSLLPLSATLGVEIKGMNPCDLSAGDIDTFKRAFDERHCVLVRGVNLSEDESVSLAEQIGSVSTAGANMKGGRRFTYVSNVHEGGRVPDGELLFHADHMFMEHPLKAISLYSLMVPSRGGETCFLDASAAYEALPVATKLRLAGLTARHVYDYASNKANQPADRDSVPEDAVSAVHPIVLTHPETGKRVLFVCRLFTVEIVGMARAESDELLQFLFNHLDSMRADYEHSWRVGDFLIWDNRILQHSRKYFEPAEKRAVRRVPIAADAP